VLLFRRVSEADIEKRLAMICEHEKVALDPEVLAEIARDARGGMRDAETALERVLAVARGQEGTFDVAAWRELQGRLGGERALEAVLAVAQGEAGPALHFADAVIAAGVDERDALGEVLELLRSALLLLVDGKDSPLVTASGALREKLLLVAGAAGIARLDAMIQAGILGRERLRRLEDRRLVLELSLLRMAQAGSVPLLGELLAAAREGRELEPAAEPAEAQAPRQFGSGPAAPPPGAARPQAAPPPQAPQRAASAKTDAKPLPGASGPVLKQELLRRMQLVRPLFAATIELCQVQGPDEGGGVTLRLATDKKLHLDRLGSDALQKELAQMLSEIAGRPVTLRVELAAQPPPQAPAAPSGPRPAPGPAVRRVQQMFDGTIVEDHERPTS
jgi:DNA polymerase III gamma/tau subunit